MEVNTKHQTAHAIFFYAAGGHLDRHIIRKDLQPLISYCLHLSFGLCLWEISKRQLQKEKKYKPERENPCCKYLRQYFILVLLLPSDSSIYKGFDFA